MEDTFTLTRTELKGFFKCISKKFNIPYKTIAVEYNAYIETLSEEENSKVSIDCTEDSASNNVAHCEDVNETLVDVAAPATCTVVKKDKTVCGKKATVGDRCSVHKPKKATPANDATPATCTVVKKDKTVCGKKATFGDRCTTHKPKKAVPANNAVPSTPSDDVVVESTPSDEAVPTTCTVVKKDKTVCGKKATFGDRCSVHKPKKATANEDKPLKKQNKTTETTDILLSPLPEPTKIVYKIEMHPRLGLYWDRTGGTRFVFSKKTGKYVAIAKYTHMTLKLSDSDIELCKKFSLPYVLTDLKDLQPEYPDQITIDGEYHRIKFELENEEFERQRLAKENISSVPVVDVPASVPLAEVPETVPVAEVPASSPVVDVPASVPVVEVPETVPVADVPAKKTGRVKNLSVDPKKFPKHRKDVKIMDIVDSLKEITLEPELEDTIV